MATSGDALVARMTSDAQTRVAALRAQADAEIAARERARAEAAARDESRQRAVQRTERERRFAVEHMRARRAAAQRVLSAQHALVERVLARALVAADTTEDRLVAALPAWIDALARHLGGEAVTLRCQPALAVALEACAAALGEVEVVVDDRVSPGFVAVTREDRCTIDCTLAARLAALRPQLQAALLARALR